MNLPIYRAKKIDSDDWVEGYLTENNGGYKIEVKKYPFVNGGFVLKSYFIDQKTLASHMDGMIDKNGKKIFASLSEGGVGGDRVFIKGEGLMKKHKEIVIYKNHKFGTKNIFDSLDGCEIIGIHKG